MGSRALTWWGRTLRGLRQRVAASGRACIMVKHVSLSSLPHGCQYVLLQNALLSGFSSATVVIKVRRWGLWEGLHADKGNCP